MLVRPRGGLNVGSVARVIKNFTAASLCVVDGEFDLADASMLAVHGADVLAARSEVATLEAALVGAGLVVGTTARPGAYRDRARELREIAPTIAAACRGASGGLQKPPAIVFGPEDSGLSNRDIALCHELAYIPTGPDYASLNLSHAVAVVLYEVFRADLELAGAHEVSRPRADAVELESAMVSLEQALRSIDFLNDGNAAHMMQTIRAMFGRAHLDDREVRILRGIATQLTWFSQGGHRVLDAKRRVRDDD